VSLVETPQPEIVKIDAAWEDLMARVKVAKYDISPGVGANPWSFSFTAEDGSRTEFELTEKQLNSFGDFLAKLRTETEEAAKRTKPA
jgi:hypothetical protein